MNSLHGHSPYKKLGAFLHESLLLGIRRKRVRMSTENLFETKITLERTVVQLHIKDVLVDLWRSTV